MRKLKLRAVGLAVGLFVSFAVSWLSLGSVATDAAYPEYFAYRTCSQFLFLSAVLLAFTCLDFIAGIAFLFAGAIMKNADGAPPAIVWRMGAAELGEIGMSAGCALLAIALLAAIGYFALPWLFQQSFGSTYVWRVCGI